MKFHAVLNDVLCHLDSISSSAHDRKDVMYVGHPSYFVVPNPILHH